MAKKKNCSGSQTAIRQKWYSNPSIFWPQKLVLFLLCALPSTLSTATATAFVPCFPLQEPASRLLLYSTVGFVAYIVLQSCSSKWRCWPVLGQELGQARRQVTLSLLRRGFPITVCALGSCSSQSVSHCKLRLDQISVMGILWRSSDVKMCTALLNHFPFLLPP